MAERVGFEPTVRYKRTPIFKTGAINQLDHLSMSLSFQNNIYILAHFILFCQYIFRYLCLIFISLPIVFNNSIIFYFLYYFIIYTKKQKTAHTQLFALYSDKNYSSFFILHMAQSIERKIYHRFLLYSAKLHLRFYCAHKRRGILILLSSHNI